MSTIKMSVEFNTGGASFDDDLEMQITQIDNQINRLLGLVLSWLEPGRENREYVEASVMDLSGNTIGLIGITIED